MLVLHLVLGEQKNEKARKVGMRVQQRKRLFRFGQDIPEKVSNSTINRTPASLKIKYSRLSRIQILCIQFETLIQDLSQQPFQWLNTQEKIMPDSVVYLKLSYYA